MLSVGLIYRFISEEFPMPTATKTLWFHRDHLGTPRAVTNENGVVESLHDYTPFGIELPSNYVSPNTRQFTGQERDRETGLDYFIARYMNPRDCRFTQVDPIKGSAGSPQSWNAYAYTANNPMKYIDPSGMAGVDTGGLINVDSSKGGQQEATAGFQKQSASHIQTERERAEAEEREMQERSARRAKRKEFEKFVKEMGITFDSKELMIACTKAYVNSETFQDVFRGATFRENGEISIHSFSGAEEFKDIVDSYAGEVDYHERQKLLDDKNPAFAIGGDIYLDSARINIKNANEVGSAVGHEAAHIKYQKDSDSFVNPIETTIMQELSNAGIKPSNSEWARERNKYVYSQYLD